MPEARRSASARLAILAPMILALSMLACGFEGGAFSRTPAPQATARFQHVPMTVVLPPPALATAATTTAWPATTAAPPATAGPPELAQPIEQLVILSPLAGQGVRNSIRVTGISDPTHEQQVSILIRDQNGAVIGSALTRLQVAAGQRGRFAAEVLLPAYLPPQAGRVVVYALSPRDGGPTHLASVDVQLNSDAPPIGPAIDPDQREMIAIVEPSTGAALRGAVSVTARTMLARDLVVEVRGAHNETLGRVTRTLENVAGLPALLVIDVPFSVTQATPGRVVVYALHARDGQTLHLSSVDVNLQP